MKPLKRIGSHSAPPDENSNTARISAFFRKKPKKQHIYLMGILLAVIFLAAAAITIRTVSDRKQYKQYISMAKDNFAQQEYDSALSNLRKALSAEHTEECVILMAECYRAQGKYDKALETLRAANTRAKSISAKIKEIERERDSLRDAEKISVAGKMYPESTTDLVLDDLSLDNSVLDDVIKLYSLTDLSLQNNKLTDISALSSLGGLSTLNLSGNKIRDISPLLNLTGLRTLYLDDNPIENLSRLCELTSLTSLSIRGIEVDEKTIDQISKALPNCAIQSEAAKEAVQDITIGGVTFKSDVTELSLSGMGLRDISALSNCTGLVKLDLSGNNISDLSPLMNMPGLEWLDVSHNELSDLKTLMGIDSLRFLNAAENSITGTSALSMMTDLRTLYIDSNPIRDFSGIRKLQNIENLGLGGTGLRDEDLEYIENLTQLTSLNISDNPELSGEAIGELQQRINPCNIEHSELVYSIDFDGHTVRSDAEELDLSATGVTDFRAIQSMTGIKTVNLSKNGISNIYPLEYTNSRFTIQFLDLSLNNIEDITALACLQSIEELNLSGNMISSVLPLMRLETLKLLDLRDNQISEESIRDLRYALQSCEILSDYD